MHILIIEDEEQLCCSIAEGLRMNGYETDTCFDGDEGLELVMTVLTFCSNSVHLTAPHRF